MSAVCSDQGIDTVRFRWRTDNDVYRKWEERPNGTIEGYRGERFDQTPLGRLGVYRDGLVYLEGRASALLNQDPDDHDLLHPTDLLSAAQVSLSFVQELGCPVPDTEPVRLGRADLAAEMRFSNPREGSAFLHSLSSLDVPWCKSRTDGRKGNHIETVSFHGTNGKSIYLRAYDKGVESGTAAPGARLRLERQKRFRKDREPDVSMFATSDLRKMFVGREFSRLVDLPCATVCDVPEALEVLAASAQTWRQYERMAAYIVVGDDIIYPRDKAYARAAELRSLGIFVDPTQIERVEVPVGRYLHALASAWSAAA